MNHRKRFVGKLREARFRLAVAAAHCAIIICFLLTLLAGSSAFAESHGGQSLGAVTDFVDFWAAARLLIQGGNPFSPAEVLELQKSVGFTDSKPLLMWNPPWTLSFVLPFGAMDFRLSQFLWLLLHVLLTLVSAQKLWVIYGQPEGKTYLPWLAALTFIPTWFVLILGQISPLILLGIVGFLHFEKKNNWLLAGIATTLISVKPHLAYLFWLGILLWIVHQSRWMVALGALVAGLIIAAIPAMIDPAVYSQFLEMYRNPGRTTPFELPAPSLGSLLTASIPHTSLPIQFLPPLLGVLWFVWHWTRYKDHWEWHEQMPIILLVSLTMSAYAWTYDYVILLPAVIHGLVLLTRGNAVWYKNGTLLSYGLINLLYLLLKFVLVSDYYYFWLAPAYLLIYLTLPGKNNSTLTAN